VRRFFKGQEVNLVSQRRGLASYDPTDTVVVIRVELDEAVKPNYRAAKGKKLMQTIEDGAEVTQQQCQELFEAYNQRFFGGRLPTYRIVLSDRFVAGPKGLCRKKEREIHLGTGLRGTDLPRLLLHEMAHAAFVARAGHGKQWLAEMLRLAEMGAPTREDWEIYQDRARTMGLREIAAEVYDAGVETDWPWRDMRLCLGRRYGLTDYRGQSESKSAANTLRRLRKEFLKGRRHEREAALLRRFQ